MTRAKVWFLGGMAAGFVLGARAGRGRYDALVQVARKVKDNPAVQEAAGVVQERTVRLYTQGKTLVNERLNSGSIAEGGILRSLRSRCRCGSTPPVDGPDSVTDPLIAETVAAAETVISEPIDAEPIETEPIDAELVDTEPPVATEPPVDTDPNSAKL